MSIHFAGARQVEQNLLDLTVSCLNEQKPSNAINVSESEKVRYYLGLEEAYANAAARDDEFTRTLADPESLVEKPIEFSPIEAPFSMVTAFKRAAETLSPQDLEMALGRMLVNLTEAVGFFRCGDDEAETQAYALMKTLGEKAGIDVSWIR